MVLCPTSSATEMQAQSRQTTGYEKDPGFARQVWQSEKGVGELKEYKSEWTMESNMGKDGSKDMSRVSI